MAFSYHRGLGIKISLVGLVLGIMSVYSGSSLSAAVPQLECQNVPSEWIFCNDFDTNISTIEQQRAKWDDYDGATDVNFIQDVWPSQTTGNRVAQFRVASGQRGNADLVKVLSTPKDKLYARWYIQYETGFNFSAPNHGGGLIGGDRNYIGVSWNKPNGTDWFSAWVDYTNTTPYYGTYHFYSYYPWMYQDCSSQGSCFGDSFPCIYDTGSLYCTNALHRPTVTLPVLQTGQWYCVEMMLDAGTTWPTGSEQLWLNGQSLGQWNNLFMRSNTSLKIENLWLNLFHHDGTHSTAWVLYDNVVVSTARIGCASSSTDTTPPVVTLAGANPLSLVQGSSFTEPGASWTDTVDGSWNTFTGTYGSLGSFARSGSVNTSLPGTYTLQYRKVDRAGNATTLSRTVTVTAVSTTPFASGFCNTVNIPSTECLALEKLYQNTNGANWTTKNNWWTNTNVATWTGVTLSWGTVYTLRLINNNLSGPLTANGFTFSDFKNLYAVYLAENTLTGNLPANTFSWLTQLVSITFYSNQLSGTLPPNLFTWLSRVRYINFHTNQLSGVLPPTLLSGLTNLDTLYLNTNQFTGTLSSTFFSWLTKLNIISLYNNSLSWTFPTVPSSVTVGSIYNNAFNFSSFSNNFLSIVSRAYSPQKNITLKLRYVLDASDAGTLSGTTNTYTWYSSTGVIATTTNNPLLIVSDTGTYRVEVRNSLITNTNNSTTNLVISSKVLTF